jgi:hypothetical protein
MRTRVLHDDDLRRKLISQPHNGLYACSLWRAGTGKYLFDGAAGDLTEARGTLHAHVRYLSAGRETLIAEE